MLILRIFQTVVFLVRVRPDPNYALDLGFVRLVQHITDIGTSCKLQHLQSIFFHELKVWDAQLWWAVQVRDILGDLERKMGYSS